jgi:hypothetical protein
VTQTQITTKHANVHPARSKLEGSLSYKPEDTSESGAMMSKKKFEISLRNK